MATTISSGRANSPKLTANIADHGTIYGGRGLIFDGVTDYLDCGTGLGSSLGDNYAGSLTISLWFKADVTDGDDGLFNIGNFSGSEGELSLSIISDKLRFKLNNGGWKVELNPFTSTDWNHVACVYSTGSESNSKMYLNGESVGTASGTFPSASDIDLNGLKTILGAYYSGSYLFDGSMSDVKVFNTALTEAQIQELYLKPEQSAPSAVQDNLVAWYPMCEGNPDSPQSVVYDHSEKGKLGTNFVDDDTASQYTTVGNNTVANVTDGIKITYVDNSTGAFAYLNTTDIVSSNLTVGNLYKATYNAYYEGGSSGVQVSIYNGSAEVYGSALTTSNTEYSIYFSPTNNDSFIRLQNLASSNVVYRTNLKVQEVLMGNHATTNFFGDELVTNGDMGSAPTMNSVGFTYYDGSGTTESGAIGGVSNTYKLDGGSANDHNARIIPNDSSLVGKTLSISVKVYAPTGTGNVDLRFVNHAGSASTLESTTTKDSWVTLSGTAVYDGVNAHAINIQWWTANQDIYIDDLTIKEVGISSSGFATADSEPTIPQVPLLRYNEKMVFSSGKNTFVKWSNPNILSDSCTAFSYSVWFQINDTNVDDGVITFTDDLGSANTGVGLRISSNRIVITLKLDGSYEFLITGFTDTGWNHAVFVYDGSSYSNTKLYLNGYVFGTASSSSFPTSLNFANTELYLGTYYLETGYSMDGCIDELSVYNTTLSSTEVGELFNDGVALDATTHSKAGNLLGYWRNDGISSWTDRRGWSYLDFDGSGDRTENTSFTTHQSDTGTISGWFKFDDVSTQQRFFGVGGSTTLGATRSIEVDGGNIYFIGYGSANVQDWNSTASAVVGRWYHLAVTWNGTSIVVYVDGTAYSQTLSGLVTPTGTKVQVGGAVWDGQYELNGQVKSASFYTAVLSASEIQSIYNKGINSSEIGNSNLAHYWVMDNASTVKDLVGSNNLTVTNATLNSGNNGTPAGTPESIIVREGLNSNKDGLGFPFKNDNRDVLRLGTNSSGEYVSIADSDSFDIQGDFTIEFWMKQPDMGTGYQHIINRDDTSNRNWSIQSINGAISLGYYSGGSFSNTQTSSAYDDDNWHHICAVFTAGTSVQIYIDKVLAKLNTTSIPTTVDNDPVVFNIGRRADATQYFIGLIDEVRFYNKALTAYESDGSAPEEGETATSGEVVKNYKHGKGKHKN